MRVREAPNKISKRVNASPKNKKRKAMNYKPSDQVKHYAKKKKTEKLAKQPPIRGENPIEKVLKKDKVANYEISFENYFNKPKNQQKYRKRGKELSFDNKESKKIFKKKQERGDRFGDAKNNKIRKLMIKRNSNQQINK